MSTTFYYNTVINIYNTLVLWKYIKALKDGLPDPRGSLENEIPSRAIEQANQQV